MQMFQLADTQLIQSPLNYTGGKYKLLPQILPLFPKEIDCFVDLFCGGCNVGINIDSKRVIYNDVDEHLFYLFNTFKNLDKDVTFELIFKIISDYDLSLVCEHGYDYYHCESGKGVGSFNKERFLKLRDDFNHHKQEDYYYYLMLYVLIIYAFNNQIRFNAKGEYNLPVGKRDFNKKMQTKLSAFIDRLHNQNCCFSCKSFTEFDVSALTERDFVYVDPPYLITCATYNEQDGWNEEHEKELLHFLDELNSKGIRFALSNVLRSKGKENTILIEWLSNKKYKTHHLDYGYSNSNYQTKDKQTKSEEVLITNY